MDVENFLSDVSDNLKNLSLDLNQALWDLETTGTKEAQQKQQELDLAYKKYLNNPLTYTKLKKFQKDNSSSRELNVLERTFRAHLMPEEILTKISLKESEIMHQYVSFRPTVDGKALTENEIREILTKENDPAFRKKVWEASKEIGAILAPNIIELVKLRNEGAKAMGFDNYFQMQLELQEVDENWLMDIFERLYQASDAAYTHILQEIHEKLAKRFSVPENELGPWAYSEPFFQEDPLDTKELDDLVKNVDFIASAKDFFHSLGFCNVEEVIEKSDLYEREGKNQHAFCINIDRSKDIRTLNNLKPSLRWLETLMHELGHAVYEQGFHGDLSWTLREPPHMITTEAMALICGRQVYLPKFWENKNVDPDLVQRASKSLVRRQLIFSRWVMVMTAFEKSLYENPDQNLNKLWWELVEKYQHIKPNENRENNFDWASKYHIGLAPVYYFSYLLGEMFASSIEKKLNGFMSSQTADYLNEHLFAPGNKYPWYDLVKNVVQTPLHEKHWIEEFVLS
ncbi:MAG: M2 family metallopeptidase [Chlamydiota bacterium]|jgi:peptidyl-dipeptidase A